MSRNGSWGVKEIGKMTVAKNKQAHQMSKERKENVVSLVTTGPIHLRTNPQLFQDLQIQTGFVSQEISLELLADSSQNQLLS